MGPLELAVYRKDLSASRAHRRRTAEIALYRQPEAVAGGAQDRVMKAAGVKPGRSQNARVKRAKGFAALRTTASRGEKTEVRERDAEAPTPGRVAARLLLARLFDLNRSILDDFRTSSPVVLVDVPDHDMFNRVAHQWRDILSLDALRFVDIGSLSDRTKRHDYDAISVVTNVAIPVKDRPASDTRAFAAVQLALPVLAITPSASYLSTVFLEAATAKLTLPPIDAALIERTISIVTGKKCTVHVPDYVASFVGLRELLLSVRFDREPRECTEHLVRLVKAKNAKRQSRDLRLNELHGLDEAVAWAKSTLIDLEAWRRGEIGWEAIDNGVVFAGPSGTGKTLLAASFAAEARLPLISVTLQKWQGSGEGHLGHLLREMNKDFDEARAKAPAVFFVDELDSFANRSELTHSHKDYVVSVVNGFIEQVDGVRGSQLLFVGATNDVTRCDPAIIRAGRFNRVIEVGLPGPGDIEKMLRVRLRGELSNESLDHIAMLALGSTGADVERIVKDARRAARHQGRVMTIADLRVAITDEDELPDTVLQRTAVHEAGHIVATVIHNGADDVHAVLGSMRGASGFVTSLGTNYFSGTLEECHRSMQIMLAGRAAEEIVLSAGGNGFGGNSRSDMAAATRLAAAMVGSYGHSGPHPLVYVAEHTATKDILKHRYMRTAAQAELSKALQDVKKLLGDRVTALRAVAERLYQDRKIDGIEVVRIMQSFDITNVGGRAEITP
jgi:cell division protease FtsH